MITEELSPSDAAKLEDGRQYRWKIEDGFLGFTYLRLQVKGWFRWSDLDWTVLEFAKPVPVTVEDYDFAAAWMKDWLVEKAVTHRTRAASQQKVIGRA